MIDTAAGKLMKRMKEGNRTKLAATAAKKHNAAAPELPKGVSTRTKSKMQPVDPQVKTFTLANVKKAKSKKELMFQIQECAALFGTQFNRLGLEIEDKSSCVAFFLKEFQRQNIFANCDSIVFHSVGNTVGSLVIPLRN